MKTNYNENSNIIHYKNSDVDEYGEKIRIKKRYVTYDKEQIVYNIIYCNKNGNETPENIARAIVTEFFVGKFVAKDYVSVVSPIKNDNNMFILKDMNGHYNIWQICGKVSDYVDAIVPHLYRIRKIGIILD